jgi:hypothetical protein
MPDASEGGSGRFPALAVLEPMAAAKAMALPLLAAPAPRAHAAIGGAGGMPAGGTTQHVKDCCFEVCLS